MLTISLVGLIPIAMYSRTMAHASGVPPEFISAAAGSITLLALIMVIANFGATFEAIVMGAHRIDLTRAFSIVSTAAEAVAIITLCHFGYGLYAMACTMAVSELVYVFCCFVASRRVLPEIRIRVADFTGDVFHELLRFAGSYQLVNVLEVLIVCFFPSLCCGTLRRSRWRLRNSDKTSYRRSNRPGCFDPASAVPGEPSSLPPVLPRDWHGFSGSPSR